jgi:FAD:protein FMN transferase
MGLPVSVLARGELARSAEADREFSPFRPDSQVSRLARGEIALADSGELVREVARVATGPGG